MSSYVAGRMLGATEAQRWLLKQVGNPDLNRMIPAADAMPGVRTIVRLRELAEVELYLDTGASHVAKSRSRCAHLAIESDADLWVTVDDDLEADLAALGGLLVAVAGAEPRVCLAPYLLRGTPNLAAVQWAEPDERRELAGVVVRRAVHGGLGLVAVNRAALDELAGLTCSWFDEVDGQQKRPLFAEAFVGSQWLGEDLSFFHRLPPTIAVEGLCIGETIHSGYPLALRRLLDLG